MLIILLMTAFFTAYLGFEPMNWSTWGPFAAVLGIVVKAGIHHTWNSADRGLLRGFWNFIMNNAEEQNNSNNYNASNHQDDHELGNLSRNRITNA